MRQTSYKKRDKEDLPQLGHGPRIWLDPNIMFGFGAMLLQGVIESEFTQYSQVVYDWPCLGFFLQRRYFLIPVV
jgi:hypothetical protein